MTDTQQRSASPEEYATITISLDHGPELVRFLQTEDVFGITYICLGQGMLAIGSAEYTFRQGDVCLTGPDFPYDLRFAKRTSAAGRNLLLGRVRFQASEGWRQFMNLPENSWMNDLLQSAAIGLFVKGDHHNELEKLFRQMLAKPNRIDSPLFLRFLREIFDLQKRTGKAKEPLNTGISN